MDLRFRPLAEADLPLLHTWLNRFHVREQFAPGGMTPEQVAAKYLPRIRGEEPTHCHFATLNEQPIGFLQCYTARAYPDFARDIGTSEGVGIDLFLADPSLIGQGIGSRMLSAYIGDIALLIFPNEPYCYISHALDNQLAIGASRAAGFEDVKEITENGQPSLLLRVQR
jgi:aminoglycoside 6'-N-acetyltransferase